MTEFSKTALPDGSLELVGFGDGRIISLGDLIEYFKIDLNHWAVAQFKPNVWETHFKLDGEIVRALNHQSSARLVPNKDYFAVNAAVQELLKSVAASAPVRTKINRGRIGGEQFLLEIDFTDIHMGMLSWAQETGEDPFDSEICFEIIKEKALEYLLARASGFPISKILIPMANDLLHADKAIGAGGSGGSTHAGTPVDVDTRHLKMFRNATNLMVAIIDRCREIAPVEVLVVPGNHDFQTSQYVGEVLCAWYRRDPEVTINNGANPRKYVWYGSTLLGFTHGDQEKLEGLPLIMASEQPQAWAETDYHVFHTGHTHKRRAMSTVTTDTYNGVEVRTIPSLVPPDAWHSRKGYVGGGRSAEAHLFEKHAGPAGYFMFNLPRKAPGSKNTQLIVVE